MNFKGYSTPCHLVGLMTIGAYASSVSEDKENPDFTVNNML